MRILIVVPEQDRISGNWVTAQRFRQGLEKHSHQVALHGTQLHPGGELREQLLEFVPDITMLLHAYRSGQPWLEATVGLYLPYVVVLTGTDVNHGLDAPEQKEVIRTILQQATFVLLQNPLIAAELSVSHPELTANLRELTPGTSLGTAPYNLRDRHALSKALSLFLCPAGLRPVKGVLELLLMFDQIALKSTSFQIAFCGPVLDESYSKRFLAEIEQRSWASYLGAIPAEAMASAMRSADVILNNSQTEGLANTLLEAATLGIPILASNIPGNAAVVKHDRNGLLYDNEAEFVQYALQLLALERRQRLTCPDPNRYNSDKETAELISILLEAVK